MKVKGTHQLLVYADDADILGGSVNTIKENAKSLLVAIKETGLEVNADKTKYMVMSQDQNAGRSHNINIYISFFERVKSSNIWEQPYQIKILFRKQLRED